MYENFNHKGYDWEYKRIDNKKEMFINRKNITTKLIIISDKENVENPLFTVIASVDGITKFEKSELQKFEVDEIIMRFTALASQRYGYAIWDLKSNKYLSHDNGRWLLFNSWQEAEAFLLNFSTLERNARYRIKIPQKNQKYGG